MSNVSKVIDPEIPPLREKLAESVAYAAKHNHLAADMRTIAELKPQAADLLGGALTAISNITDYQERKIQAAKGGLSFVALDDARAHKAPYDFSAADLKALVAFGARLPANHQAADSYRANVLDTATALLDVKTVSAPIRQLRRFYNEHFDHLGDITLRRIEDECGHHISESYQKAVNFMHFLMGPKQANADLEEFCASSIKRPINKPDVKALLDFGDTLGNLERIFPVWKQAKAYREIEPAIKDYINNLVPSLSISARS